MGEEWMVVRKGSKQCARWKSHQLLNLKMVESDSCTTSDMINDIKKDVAKSEFWMGLQLQFQSCSIFKEYRVPWLICLGIGSAKVGDKYVFTTQLAIALLIRDYWNIPKEKTWISDPVMADSDFDLMEQLDFATDRSDSSIEPKKISKMPSTDLTHLCSSQLNTPHERQSAPSADSFLCNNSFISLSLSLKNAIQTDNSPILLFMPHCDKPVYGECLRLIDSLSSPSALSRCILVGNELKQYDKFQACRFYRDNSSEDQQTSCQHNQCQYSNSCQVLNACQFLDRLLPKIESITLDTIYRDCPRAFNNLCMSLIHL